MPTNDSICDGRKRYKHRIPRTRPVKKQSKILLSPHTPLSCTPPLHTSQSGSMSTRPKRQCVGKTSKAAPAAAVLEVGPSAADKLVDRNAVLSSTRRRGGGTARGGGRGGDCGSARGARALRWESCARSTALRRRRRTAWHALYSQCALDEERAEAERSAARHGMEREAGARLMLRCAAAIVNRQCVGKTPKAAPAAAVLEVGPSAADKLVDRNAVLSSTRRRGGGTARGGGRGGDCGGARGARALRWESCARSSALRRRRRAAWHALHS